MLSRTLSLSLRCHILPILRLPSMASQLCIHKQRVTPLYGGFATLKRTENEEDLEQIHEADRIGCRNDPLSTINKYPFDQIPTSLIRTPEKYEIDEELKK